MPISHKTEELYEHLFVKYFKDWCKKQDECEKEMKYVEEKCGFNKHIPEICINGAIRAKKVHCEEMKIEGFCDEFTTTEAENSNVALIIGVIGGALFLCMIMAAVFCCIRRKKKQSTVPADGYAGENAQFNETNKTDQTTKINDSTTQGTSAVSTNASTAASTVQAKKKNKKKKAGKTTN